MLKGLLDFFVLKRKGNLRVLALGWIFLLFCSVAFAQKDTLKFRKISTADGLSQSSVIAISQDHLGRIWLGTRDGLNIYNGNSFKVFRNNPNDSLSISNSDILSIDEDQDGYIWVGTYSGLNRYNPKKNRFKRFFHSGKNSILSNRVWSIKVMKNGKVWLGTAKGVSVYNPENEKITSLPGQKELGDYLVRKILETKNGKIWLATSVGIIKVIKGDEHKFSLQLLDKNVFAQDIVEGPLGKIWVATKNQGLFSMNPQTEKIKPVGSDNTEKIFPNVRSLAFDQKGVLWIGTYEGLYQYFPNGKINRAVNDPFNKNSLSQNSIKSVFVDKKGSVWIGTYYGGADLWDPSNTNFNNYSRNSGKNGLGYNVVSSVESKGATLFFGTEGGGVTLLNTKNQAAKYLDRSTVKNFPSNNIKAMLLTKNHLWLGTFNAGIAVYDLQSKKILPEKIPKKLKDYLERTGVYAIKQDKNGILWLGTFGKGLVRFDVKAGTFRYFSKNSGGNKSILGDFIRTLLVDKQNNLWVGTNKGVNKLALDSLGAEKTHFKYFLFDEQRSTGEDILSLFEDQQGKIWVGTKYSGLFIYKNDTLQKQPIALADKRLNVIHAVVEDADGKIWLSSNQGIVAYAPQKNTSTLYSQKEGLVSNEFNDNASYRLNSTIYFGGPAGVTFFNPKAITENNYAPQVILTDFKIQNKSVPADQKNGILQNSIAYTKEIELSYDKANFSIDYAIPNFINASNNRYKYRLKGLEDQWNKTSNTEANYVIQNPGTYTFQVKGANNDGVWNKTATKLTIIVHPAPWRSIWAFLLYGILIAAALYGLLWIMKSKTKLQNKLQLEQLESENNRKINQAKLEFFTNISHEFRTPLTLILGPLQQLLADYKGSNLMYKKLLVIESSANHLLQLINQLMNFRKLENKQVKLEAAEGNIVKFLKEIYLSFSEYAEDGKYDYTFETSSEKILVYYDRPKLERVFYNLISNAFRYTPKGGTISLEITQTTGKITICVKDSGQGIPEDSLEKIFDRFYEVDKKQPQEEYNQGTGIGLSIARNIVHLHNGKISAKNQPQGGAVFCVKLKTGREHLSEKDILKNFKFSDDVSQYANQLKKPEEVLSQEFDDLVLEEGKHTLLLVEDNKPLLSFMHNLLKNEYNIIEAENGKIALQQTLKYMPDLIVSDVIMPEMVGTELCSQIKKNVKTSHIPVILLTSRSALIYKFEGLESGADDYISKPFNVKEFLLRIKNLIDSTQRLKEKFSSESNLVPEDITVSSLDEKLLKKALELVRENISNEQFNIPTFSAELGVSRTMLFTKVKAWTNCTPNEFIQEVRMKHAAKLLEQGKINISEVSYKVGFKNPKYFAKCFQKKYGKTPTQYSRTFFDDSGNEV